MSTSETASSGSGGTHVESEDHPWGINIPDHAGRTESAAFRHAKDVAKQILGTLAGQEPYGPGPWQMHHGGSLWVFAKAHGWMLFLNTVGIEWSAQFCADPAKVDVLRRNAQVMYAAFPETVPEMVRLGYAEAEKILATPITDAPTIGVWVDSVFNSCVPLAAPIHTGVLPAGGGCHHYPAPITDIVQIKHGDFELWVTDPVTKAQVAVLPVAPRGSGDGRVTLTYAPPGTPLAQQKIEKAKTNERVVFAPDSEFARQAFANQTPAAPAAPAAPAV